MVTMLITMLHLIADVKWSDLYMIFDHLLITELSDNWSWWLFLLAMANLYLSTNPLFITEPHLITNTFCDRRSLTWSQINIWSKCQFLITYLLLTTEPNVVTNALTIVTDDRLMTDHFMINSALQTRDPCLISKASNHTTSHLLLVTDDLSAHW